VRNKIITLSVVLGLCVPGVAAAATPTQDTYSGSLGQVSGASNGGGPSNGTGPSDAARSGTPASATSPSSSAHVAASTSTPSTTSSATPSSSGSLPFTGLDVGVVAAIGLGLAGLGFATRRATRTAGSVRP